MSDGDCVFCGIASGVIPADVVYREGDILAFRDLNPQAPIHVLVIPERHISSAFDLGPGETPLLGRMFAAVRAIGEQEGIAGRGLRVVVNAGPEGGQTVAHLHFHVLGGRRMTWPPG
jgi:histidine triad (HIT) family protein